MPLKKVIRFASVVAVSIFMLWIQSVSAQPQPLKPIGSTIADTGCETYRFETFKLDSLDGERHYRVTLASPKSEPPENGSPIVYLLDGNAVLASLTEDLLKKLIELGSPVLVAVGYETDLKFDTVARSYDYTPTMPDGSEPDREGNQGRRGGGADIFAELLRSKIKPEVERRVKIDPKRQAVWGHSYGGLCVLNLLLRHTNMFECYLSSSPSLWWQNGVIFQYEKKFPSNESPRNVRLVVLLGSKEHSLGKVDDPGNPRRQKMIEARRSIPPDSWSTLPKRLASVLEKSEYLEIPDLDHGRMLAASLEPAFRFFLKKDTPEY